MNKAVLIIVAVVIIILAGFGIYAGRQAQIAKQQEEQKAMQEQKAMEMKQQEEKNAQLTQAAEMAKTKVVQLAEENKSGESGTATLEEQDGKVKVTIKLTGESAGASQPVHIHSGVCPGVGKVLYPLTNIVNGASETTINVSMDDLLKQLPLAINAHKSAQAITIYTACGVIAAPSVTPAISMTPTVTHSVTPSPTTTPTRTGY